MATQILDYPQKVVSPADPKGAIAARMTVLGQRIEALVQAAIDANDEVGSDISSAAQARHKINFMVWPLLDAAREAGREVRRLGR